MIKKLSIIYFILSSFFFSNLVLAENLTINYVDVEKILNNSKVGKKINTSLEALLKKKNNEFKKIEKGIKEKDEKLSKQKNILSPEELKNKISELQNDIKEYRNKKEKFNKDINQKRLKATGDALVYLNKILAEYASKNSISMIIQKKNIIIGKSDMDITDKILKIFDKEVKDIKIN